MPNVDPSSITLKMMRESLYVAVVCDALDSVGCTHCSPRVTLSPRTVDRLLVGRCKTTLWADMYHVDPRPYELE
ncbi:MAG: RraA family protein, partial [Planctomycetales bacterium]|nr:RraA family protein [Planctomycetales bacterium]